MPKQHTVTTVKEYEYSEDGYLLKETVTVTTVEPDVVPAPPSGHFPGSRWATSWDRYPVGGHLRTYQPGEHTMNLHSSVPTRARF